MREKTERTETIIERDDDRALLREPRTVVPFLTAEPGPESAAVDPDKNGKRDAGRGKRERLRPDVEVEAVFRDAGGEGIDVGVGLMLDAVVSELASITHTRPGRRRLRWTPAQFANRRRCVWNATEDH